MITEKECPKCKGEMLRQGLISFYVDVNNEGMLDDYPCEDKINEALKYPDEFKWICRDCDYEEEE